MEKVIGAQLYTVTAFCQTLPDFDETCKKVRDIGYKTIKLPGNGILPLRR